jgi:hypothetical protein
MLSDGFSSSKFAEVSNSYRPQVIHVCDFTALPIMSEIIFPQKKMEIFQTNRYDDSYNRAEWISRRG